MAHRIEVGYRPGIPDPRGLAVLETIRSFLSIPASDVRAFDVYTVDADLSEREAAKARDHVTDPVTQLGAIDRLEPPPFDFVVSVGFRPGVTDAVGKSALALLRDMLDRPLGGNAVFTSRLYFLSGVDEKQAKRIASDLLANALIERFDVQSRADYLASEPDRGLPIIRSAHRPTASSVDLSGSDDELMRISKERILSLSLEEMQTIRDAFRSDAFIAARKAIGLGAEPTDAELECLAQTWSEHCKHKIFNATIDYDEPGSPAETIESLFKTYIRNPTERIRERQQSERGSSWLVSVFHDNAGVIAFNDDVHLVYKVETHNSPSALDPYGGAMTGIVGVNRDPFGTGLGAELLFNVWGYCFADPRWQGGGAQGAHAPATHSGRRSPRRDRRRQPVGHPLWSWMGVLRRPLPRQAARLLRHGGQDAGDQRGTEDPREGGTARRSHRDVWRAYRQGWHPRRNLLLRRARRILTRAGGADRRPHHAEAYVGLPDRSARPRAVHRHHRQWGRWAQLVGGRAVYDERRGGHGSRQGAPQVRGSRPVGDPHLRSPGTHDRCRPARAPRGRSWRSRSGAKSKPRTSGRSPDTGYFHVRYGDDDVVYLPLDFLHDGLPPMRLRATWTPPVHEEPRWPDTEDWTATLHGLLGRPNLASGEKKARHYDHEVKGLSVIKPFMGVRCDVPSDAAVFMVQHGSVEGLVLSEGLHPHYADIDTRWATASAIDEAVRKAVGAGARLDHMAGLDNYCWPDPVQSEKTPDGEYKLAQLVRSTPRARRVLRGVRGALHLRQGLDEKRLDHGRRQDLHPAYVALQCHRQDRRRHQGGLDRRQEAGFGGVPARRHAR